MLHANASPTLTRLVAVLSICFIGLTLTQCQNSSSPQPHQTLNDDLPATPLVYNNAPNLKAPGQIATWILRTRYETSRDSITNWGATLGRYIFYDKQLSANGATACASCHHQDKAFTDGEAFSTGFQGGQTKFSAMSTVNLGLTEDNDPGYFWDGRATGYANRC